MNLCDCYVTKIIGEPHYEYNKWWLQVEYACEGVTSETDLMLGTLEEAEAVQIGHHFLA